MVDSIWARLYRSIPSWEQVKQAFSYVAEKCQKYSSYLMSSAYNQQPDATPDLPAWHAPEPPAAPDPTLPQVQPSENGKRRVFVLHSGMNDRDNEGGRTIRRHLLEHGVKPEDIVVLRNEYPHMILTDQERREHTQYYRSYYIPSRFIPTLIRFSEARNTATNFYVYNRMRRPESDTAQASYRNMRAQLEAAGVGTDAELVGVAHSGGGQVLLTLDNIAAKDRRTNGQHFRSVVMLGSPIGQNHARPETQVHAYDSKDDEIVRIATEEGFRRWTGFAPRNIAPTIVPPNLDDNDRYIHVDGVGHREWFRDRQYTTRFLRDLRLVQPQAQAQAAGAQGGQ